MQFWFTHGVEVSIREQLVTQVVLGILSDDLTPGQRLPSTREVARRFHLHPNTVSAGYRQLERERWVEFRHGSGVYVRENKPETTLSPAHALDQIVANLFRSARESGISLAAVQSRIRQWLEFQPPDHFLLIEPDEELRRIVATEIGRAVTLPVKSCGLNKNEIGEATQGAIAVVLPSKAAIVKQALRPGAELLILQVRSVPSSLTGWLPAPSTAMVAIVSRWDKFLQMARTFLTAAGFESDAMIFRDASKPGWQRGLEHAAAVICDSVTAADLPDAKRIISFQLLSDSSLKKLRSYEQFIRTPLEL
jgi:DNA-binding transcriptional regulator YhcF (GntR family)